MKNDKNLISSLVEAVPKSFLQERSSFQDLLVKLTERRAGYEKDLLTREEEIASAEKDLERAVSSGQDGQKAMSRIETLQAYHAIQGTLLDMTDAEIEKLKEKVSDTRKSISAELARIIAEKRLVIAGELEEKVGEIERSLVAWRDEVLRAASALECDAPANVDVFVKSRILRDHLI